MGRGKGRKNRKPNGAQGEKLMPWTTADGKVSEPSSTMASDVKAYGIAEKRIFDLQSIGEGFSDSHEHILHELPLQEIDGGPTPGDDVSEDLPITVEPTAHAPLRSYSFTGAAVVGLDSRIYRIGGLCISVLREAYRVGKGYSSGCTDGCKGGCHAEVFCVEVVDGAQPNKEWKRCRPMNIGRKDPLAYAVDGKIYVFGGACHGPFIGEVYEPAEDKWEELPPLPDFWGYGIITPMNVVLDDPDDASNKLILVHIQDTKPLHAFNVGRKIWECFDDQFGTDKAPALCGMWPSTNAVVGNFLYCYSASRGFFAYHLNGKKWYHLNGKEWHHFHNAILKKEIDSNPALFHLGGSTLCFVWYYDIFCGEFPDVFPDMIIGCAKFKLVGTNIDDKSFESLRLGYFRHKVPAYGPLDYVLL